MPRSRYQSSIASPKNSAITPPSARNGPSGIADFRASLPCRAKSTAAGTNAAKKPTNIATITGMPRPAPRKADSLTSPRPSPRGYARTTRNSTRPAPSALRIHSRLGSSIVRSANTTTAPGRTTLSGISRCSRSVRVTITRIQQKSVAAAASSVNPKTRPHAPPSSAVPSSTSGRRGERGTRRSSGSCRGEFVAIRSASGATSTPSSSPTTPAATSTLPDSASSPADPARRRGGAFPPPGDARPSYWGR